jgi:hypothetical protein
MQSRNRATDFRRLSNIYIGIELFTGQRAGPSHLTLVIGGAGDDAPNCGQHSPQNRVKTIQASSGHPARAERNDASLDSVTGHSRTRLQAATKPKATG